MPPAPATAQANVPEAAGYGVLYQLDIPNVARFNTLASVPYAVNNASMNLPTPTRVAYFLELTNGTGTKWAWASMDNFAATLPQLGLPHPAANNVVWRQNATNLNVAASAGAGVTTGTGKTGRVEMWYWNYAQANVDNVPGASGSAYDTGDQCSLNGGYGSFQVHNVSDNQTVLAYNNWGTGGTGDLGIGNQPTGQPDWTFANSAGGYTVKRLYVLALNGGSFVQNATLSVPATGPATLAQNQVYTGATDNCGVASVSVSPTAFTCVNAGVNTVQVTVVDNAGNTTVQSAYVTVSVPTVPAVTWLGTSTDWNDCRNWTYGRVPNAATDAVVPAGLPYYPALTSGTLNALNFTVDPNAGFTLGSGATLQVYGDWTNNGTAALNGTVVLAGPAPRQDVGGTASTAFGTLRINKASGAVRLLGTVDVGTALVLSSGLVNTGSFRARLGSAATFSGETETSFLTGTLETTRAVAAAGASSTFGGLGLALAASAASTAVPGTTRVLRTTGTALTRVGSSVSVKRYFDIQPTTDTGLNVTLTFNYLDQELNGIPKTRLNLFRSTGGTAGPFIPAQFSSRNATSNTVTKSGITALSLWTLGDNANPLPVELSTFTATSEGSAAVRLAWATASERNSAAFEVERSADGATFARLGTVAAAGHSSAPRSYGFLDTHPPLHQPTLYYRLRQVDLDGTAAYSPVRTVALKDAPASARLVAYPNPARDAVRVSLLGPATSAPLQLVDALGRAVRLQAAPAPGTEAVLPLTGLPTGLYVLRCGALSQRLTVE